MRASKAPYGVVDIGSNSVRLVIFERASRTAAQLFNEKVLCGLGQGVGSTGKLNPEGARRALDTFGRFKIIAENFGVGTLDVIGTAAPRDAEDGQAFMDQAGECLGVTARLISGEEEARYAALGVLSGMPSADGIACDLGGGSLEIIRIRDKKPHQAVTVPLGALRLAEEAEGLPRDLRIHVAEILQSVPWLGEDAGPNLYAIGGLWRRLGRVHMAKVAHPLQMIQSYRVSRSEIRELTTTIVERGRAYVDKLIKLPKHRADSMPYGAVVMEQLVEYTGVDQVFFSAHGLREGLLFDRTPSKHRGDDPLIVAALELEERHSRAPGHGEETFTWLSALFPNIDARRERLHHAAAILADIAWRRHMDYRPQDGTNSALTGPFLDIDHRERAFLALAMWHRSTTSEPKKTLRAICTLMDEEERADATVLGAAIRLAFALTAGRTGILKETRLKIKDEEIVLCLNPAVQALKGEKLSQRLTELAARLGKKGQVKDASPRGTTVSRPRGK